MIARVDFLVFYLQQSVILNKLDKVVNQITSFNSFATGL